MYAKMPISTQKLKMAEMNSMGAGRIIAGGLVAPIFNRTSATVASNAFQKNKPDWKPLARTGPPAPVCNARFSRENIRTRFEGFTHYSGCVSRHAALSVTVSGAVLQTPNYYYRTASITA